MDQEIGSCQKYIRSTKYTPEAAAIYRGELHQRSRPGN